MMRFAVCVFLAAVAGCGSPQAPEPIVIGHVANRSGADAGRGKQAMDAIRLALDEINSNAELAPLHVRHTDAQGKLNAFAAEAVRLVTVSDAAALIGGTSSAEVEQLDRRLAPVIGLYGMRTPIMSDLVFLTDLSPECRGDVAAKFVVQELKVTYVLEIVDRREEEANRISAAFSDSIAKLYKRDEPLQHTTIPLLSDADITRASERIERTKPDAVVFAGKPATLVEIQRNLAHPVPVMLASAAPHDGAVRLPNDTYSISAYAVDDSIKSIRDFRAKFTRKFADEPSDVAVLAYDGIRLLARAVRDTSNPYRPEKLAESLAKIKDFPGVTGTLSFAGERQLRRPAFILRSGKHIVKHYPAEETQL